MKTDSSNTSGATGEIQFSWSTGPFVGDERGWRRKGREYCLPPTQHLLQNSQQGFSQQHTHHWHGKGSSRPPSSCSLNHGFGLPWLMVPVRAKPRPHPTTSCFHPLPASGLSPGMQVWEQPSPQFSTASSPFPFGEGQCWHMAGFRVSTGLFETSGAPLRYSKGDICPLPNRMMQDVQKDKAHPRPALVIPRLLWLRRQKRSEYHHVHPGLRRKSQD